MDQELVSTPRAELSEPPLAGAEKRVLLVAYHFPPLSGSSGVQRTLRFAQHLPKFGWRPVVLTIDSRAYDQVGRADGNEAPPDLPIYRAFGLNAATQLSVFGRYPKFLALPDRWASWALWAIPKALNIIRRHRIDVVWTTFPITTTHRIGLEIARRTHLPWIAEFRDPMWQSDWPPEPSANAAWKKLEEQIFRAADWLVFTAPSAATLYAQRFPHLNPSQLVVIENGYDEATFARVEASLHELNSPGPANRPVTLLHSGIIYSSERDPSQFFAAIANLKNRGQVSERTLRIILRASGAEADYIGHLQRLGIAEIVHVAPAVDYLAALREMLTADGLLILQAGNCNAQIPAKLYEYLRARKPILALTDPAGDTASTLQALGTGMIARLDSRDDIETKLLRFLEGIASGVSLAAATSAVIAPYSREAQAGSLARLLNRAVVR